MCITVYHRRSSKGEMSKLPAAFSTSMSNSVNDLTKPCILLIFQVLQRVIKSVFPTLNKNKQLAIENNRW